MKTLILTESKFFSLIRESVLEALACLGASYNDVRRLAHDVKAGDSDAIEQAAILMSRKVPANSILIPVPNHSGKADYTLRMTKRIAQLSKSKVLDIITATPREGTLYTTKVNYLLLKSQASCFADRCLKRSYAISTGVDSGGSRRIVTSDICGLVITAICFARRFYAARGFRLQPKHQYIKELFNINIQTI